MAAKTQAPKELGRVLLVDDDPDMLALLSSLLEQEGFRVEMCQTLDQLKAKVLQFSYDCILLDLFLGQDSSVSALPFLAREAPFAKVIVMTAHGSIELAVEAMKLGASSFVSKTHDAHRITAELKQRMQARGEVQSVSYSQAFDELGLLGRSPQMQALFDDIMQIKDSDATVLIQGESGTGKELVARAIHRLSQRKGELFAALNCAAIPENLLESELFGHRKGAFTDAKADRKGIFESASDGTLFLDEIGDMPLTLQVKLLRVLQEKEITPLGATRAIPIQTRVITATHRDLEEEIGRGRFREDLFFRINVFTLFIPPLRERKGDIGLLANAFIDSFNARYQKTIRHLRPEVALRLEHYEWPGNVRELQNALERAVVLAKTDQLELEDILRQKVNKRTQSMQEGGGDTNLSLSYAEAKENFEKSFLLRILKVSKGSISEAARISGRYRSDIYRLMERYGIEADDFKN